MTMTQNTRRSTGIALAVMTVALGVGLFSGGVGASPTPPPYGYGGSDFTVPTIPPSTTSTTQATTTTITAPTTTSTAPTTTTNPFPDALVGGPIAGSPTPTTPPTPTTTAPAPAPTCSPTMRMLTPIIQRVLETARALAQQVLRAQDPRQRLALQSLLERVREAFVLRLGAGCLAPGSTAFITLFSAPYNAGSFTVGADGTLNAAVAIPDSMPAGNHTATITGTAADGSPVTLSAPFRIVNVGGRGSGRATAAPGTLPRTGPGNTAGLLRAALLLLGMGIALALLRPSGGHYRRSAAS